MVSRLVFILFLLLPRSVLAGNPAGSLAGRCIRGAVDVLSRVEPGKRKPALPASAVDATAAEDLLSCTHPDVVVCEHAWEAIEMRYGDRVGEVLVTLLDSPEPQIREHARFLIDRKLRPDLRAKLELPPGAGDPQRAFLSRSILATDLESVAKARYTDDELKRIFETGARNEQFYASDFISGASDEALGAALRSDWAHVREKGLIEFSRRKSPAIVPRLVALADDPVVEVQKAAIDALHFQAENGSSEAGDALAKLASSSDPVVRARVAEVTRTSPAGPDPVEIAREKLDWKAREQDDHLTAFMMSNHVYSLPDFESARDAAGFLEKHEAFLKTIPEGYEIEKTIAEARNGLKWALYRPVKSQAASRPKILAISGTQDWTDILSDVGLGHSQLKSHTIGWLIEDLRDDLLAGTDVLITGHSLGGGLAQAVAYKTRLAALLASAEGRVASPKLGKLSVVTWNAFGARELIEYDNLFSSQLAGAIDTIHYVMPWDPVSHVGDSLGAIRKLPAVPKGRGLFYYHTRDAIERAIREGGLSNYRPVLIEGGRPRAQLARSVGWVGEYNQDRRYLKSLQEKAVRMTCEARLEWVRRGGYRWLRTSENWLDREIRRMFRDAREAIAKPGTSAAEKARLQAVCDLIVDYERKIDALMHELQRPRG